MLQQNKLVKVRERVNIVKTAGRVTILLFDRFNRVPLASEDCG